MKTCENYPFLCLCLLVCLSVPVSLSVCLKCMALAADSVNVLSLWSLADLSPCNRRVPSWTLLMQLEALSISMGRAQRGGAESSAQEPLVAWGEPNEGAFSCMGRNQLGTLQLHGERPARDPVVAWGETSEGAFSCMGRSQRGSL